MAVMVTVGLLAGNSSPRHHVVANPGPELTAWVTSTPLSGTNRLYGTVTTRSGQTHTGFIRWDRNEGSWADLLDATKLNDRGRSATLSGLRFGHVQRIDVTGRESARFTLRSGQRIQFGSQASDLGTGLRALTVDKHDNSQAEFEWRDLRAVEFSQAPSGARPPNGRLYGTMTTRSGHQFTGYVTWDVDEIYSSDILDGDLRGKRQQIPFGAIASIDRVNSGAARVMLHSGEEMVLRGTNDVNRRNSGISVSDPALGQVKVGWEAFDNVRFHGTDQESRLTDFGLAGALKGTVVTTSGDEYFGVVRWDRDESHVWELLDGEHRGIEFKIELGNVDQIDKTLRGVRVTLKDGRVFDLYGSNDVDHRNRGIAVGTQGRVVDWDDFELFRLEG